MAAKIKYSETDLIINPTAEQEAADSAEVRAIVLAIIPEADDLDIEHAEVYLSRLELAEVEPDDRVDAGRNGINNRLANWARYLRHTAGMATPARAAVLSGRAEKVEAAIK